MTAGDDQNNASKTIHGFEPQKVESMQIPAENAYAAGHGHGDHRDKRRRVKYDDRAMRRLDNRLYLQQWRDLNVPGHSSLTNDEKRSYHIVQEKEERTAKRDCRPVTQVSFDVALTPGRRLQMQQAGYLHPYNHLTPPATPTDAYTYHPGVNDPASLSYGSPTPSNTTLATRTSVDEGARRSKQDLEIAELKQMLSKSISVSNELAQRLAETGNKEQAISKNQPPATTKPSTEVKSRDTPMGPELPSYNNFSKEEEEEKIGCVGGNKQKKLSEEGTLQHPFTLSPFVHPYAEQPTTEERAFKAAADRILSPALNSLSNRRARLHQLARRTGLLDLIRAQKEPYWLERWQNIGDLHDEANLDALEFRNLLAVWPAGQPEFVVQGRIRAPLTLLDAMLYVGDACLNDNALNAVASVLVRKAEDEYVDPIVGSPMLWFWESEQAMDTIRHIAGRITSKTQRIFLPINVSSNGSTSISVEGKSNADHWILWVLVFKRHESRTLACQFDSLTSPSIGKTKKKGGIAAWTNAKTCIESFHRQLCELTPSIRGHALTVDIASPIPRQQNGSDCGIFVLSYLLVIAREDVQLPQVHNEIQTAMRTFSQIMRAKCLTTITDNIRNCNYDRNDRKGDNWIIEGGEGLSERTSGYVVSSISDSQQNLITSSPDVPYLQSSPTHSLYAPSVGTQKLVAGINSQLSTDADDDELTCVSEDELIYIPPQASTSNEVKLRRAYGAFSAPTQIRLPLPLRSGKYAGELSIIDPESTHELRSLMTEWLIQASSGHVANPIPCDFCSTMRQVWDNVICVGRPCRNTLMFQRPHIDQPLSRYIDSSQNLAVCTHCDVTGIHCSGVQTTDIHARSKLVQSCDACDESGAACTSLIHNILPLDDVRRASEHGLYSLQPTMVVESDLRFYICFVCPLGFPTEAEWRHHCQLHVCGAEAFCQRCLTVFHDNATLSRHVSATTSSGNQLCHKHRLLQTLPGATIIKDFTSMGGPLPERLKSYQTAAPLPQLLRSSTDVNRKTDLTRYGVILVITRFSSHRVSDDGSAVYRDTLAKLVKVHHLNAEEVVVEHIHINAPSYSLLVTTDIKRYLDRYAARKRRILLVVRGIDGLTTNIMSPVVLFASLPPATKVDILFYLPAKMCMERVLPGIIPVIAEQLGGDYWLRIPLRDLALAATRAEPRVAAMMMLDLWVVVTHAKRAWAWGETKEPNRLLWERYCGKDRNHISLPRA